MLDLASLDMTKTMGATDEELMGNAIPEGSARQDELALIALLGKAEQRDIQAIMLAYCSQTHPNPGYTFGGAIIERLTKELNRIEARKAH
jgi:hypothetical protein